MQNREVAMLVVTAFLVVGACLSSAQLMCYHDLTEPYLMMSSKTAYEFIHGQSTVENHPGCAPRQFWIMSRHGTRYPGATTIAQMIDDAPVLQANILKHPDIELCAADIEGLRDWEVTLTADQKNDLTLQGFLDLYNIARRFQQRFPSLLNVTYNQSDFEFRTGKSKRTVDSTEAFAEGLFGSTVSVFVPEPLEPDPLIEAYDACPAWLETVDGNPDSLKEMNDFIASPHVTDLVAAVSQRLGFDSSPITFADVSLIYDLCRYEKAWKPNVVSPWCAAFTTAELQVLEYIEDLSYYYTESYGSALSVRVGCPPVKDFVDRFSKLESGDATEPSGVFYFTHSTMVNMVLSRLNLYKDSVAPTSNNYASQADRKWRSSSIGAFASNIAAVMYECESGERLRFQLFVNEKAVQLDGCPTDELCSWTFVKESLAGIVENCDMSFCNVNKSD